MKIVPQESVQNSVSRYGLHPTLMDACFQAMVLGLPEGKIWPNFKIETIQAIHFWAKPEKGDELWVCIRIAKPYTNGRLAVDVKLQTKSGRTLCTIKRLKLVEVAPQASLESPVSIKQVDDLERTTKASQPGSKTESTYDTVKSIIAEVGKIKENLIDKDSEFRLLGLDSLMLQETLNRLEKRYDTRLVFADLLVRPKITDYAFFLESLVAEGEGETSSCFDTIKKIVSEVSGVPLKSIQKDSEFRLLGLDSLMLQQVKGKIESYYDVVVDYADFLTTPSIWEYANLLKSKYLEVNSSQ